MVRFEGQDTRPATPSRPASNGRERITLDQLREVLRDNEAHIEYGPDPLHYEPIGYEEFARKTGRRSKLVEKIIPPSPKKPLPDYVEEVSFPEPPPSTPFDDVPF